MLSTPSLGITTEAQIQPCGRNYFQLPLSGSHHNNLVDELFEWLQIGLSTPSLGITSAVVSDRGIVGPFNSLSRDHFCILVVNDEGETVIAFNSLSRDHMREIVVLNARILSCLSTPSLGITE